MHQTHGEAEVIDLDFCEFNGIRIALIINGKLAVAVPISSEGLTQLSDRPGKPRRFHQVPSAGAVS